MALAFWPLRLYNKSRKNGNAVCLFYETGGGYFMASLTLKNIYKVYAGGVTAVSDFNLEH